MSAASEALRTDLARLLDGHASTDDADRVAYSRDLWPRLQIATRAGVVAAAPPAVICWPATTAQVAAVVRFAAERGAPLVPYGAGSGVCAGIRPTPETILLDLKRMRRLVDVDRARLTCRAEAGIIGQHLEDALARRGLTLGHFPSSIHCSTLGGWVAGRSAGQCSGRYGKIEDMVLGLTCVDGRGEIHAVDADRDPALVPLVIGSEGIAAVVTEATLRVAPAPPARAFAAFAFETTEAGLNATRRVFQAGLRPAVARLYDPFDSMIARRGGLRGDERKKRRGGGRGPGLATRTLMKALRRPGALNRIVDALPSRTTGGAMMVLVWEADEIIAEAEKRAATSMCLALGGQDLGDRPARRWLAHRHSVSYRQSPLLAAGAFVDTMEVASTWSRLSPMYEAVRRALSPHVFVMAHFSHPYPDGASIYFTFAGYADTDAGCEALYDRAWRDALRAVVDAGGTLSHHHGVGRSKAPAMRREQGVALDVVRAFKEQMDPRGIFNPGSLLPEAP